MANKYITTYYNEIKNICDFPIDCKQGLYLSLLHLLGKPASYAGARWPWVFYYKPRLDVFDIKANKLIDIVNMLTVERVKKLFNIDLEYNFFDDCQDMMKYIQNSILNDTPVIVNTDQYYIPYHHKYIYLHKHGVHATLLLGYDDDTNEEFCFSASPEYKGTITYNDLSEGIKNSSILWCAVLKKSNESWFETNDENVFKDFQNNICEVANRYNDSGIRSLKSNMHIYTKDILTIFSECSESDDDNTYRNFKNLCDGRWGWEINTNVNLFEKYLLTDYVSRQYRDISSIINTIDEYKIKWDLAYRKMHKMLIRKPKDINKEIDLVTKDFNDLVNNEQTILNQLII